MDKTFKEHKRSFHLDAAYNKPNRFKAEGIDHVNISVLSNNKLGRFLDPGYCINIDYPSIGKFRSILSLIYWLKSPDLDDKIRVLTGTKLNIYVREKSLKNKRLPNYPAILAFATWLKIKQRPDILEEIKNFPDDFTLLSYRVNAVSGIRIATGFAPRIVPIMEEIVLAVKEDREPNFDLFVTNSKEAGVYYLEGALAKHKQ